MIVARVLLDTNVLSELMRPRPEPRVLDWFAVQGRRTRFMVSAVTQSEILLGIELLPLGKKRTALAAVAQSMFAEEFDGLNLPFDSQAAPVYATIVAERSRRGAPISVEDAQIAAIATVNRLPLATRNTKDFAQLQGLKLLDPWAAASRHDN